MLRGRSIVWAFAFFGAISICAAQDTADIIVGGQTVARVRSAGAYETVEHRAAAVDEKINALLAATDDPGTLEVSLEQVDGLWTVMIDSQAIVAVYPAEAEANGMTPEMLGAMWVRKFKDALPGATCAPVTSITEPVAGAEAPAATTAPVTTTQPAANQPIMIADEPVLSSPTAGDETVPTPAPAPTTVTPPATGAPIEVLEVPEEESEAPDQVVAGQGARLLILEAFNRSRDLPEDDYLVRREAMANQLFDDLVQMITGGRATGRIETSSGISFPTPPRPVTTTTTAPPTAGATATTATAAPPTTITVDTGPTPSAAGTTTTGAAPALAMSAASRAKIEARMPANDPSYANVVQKVAIKAKFRAASDALRTADAATRAQATEVLSAARRANTNQEWATAEQHLDTGLRLLGVTQWEQHIDAAMADLGL